MYKKILVPLDGSPTATLGLKEAVALARDQEATLVLLHVLDEHRVDLAGAEAGGSYLVAATEALVKNGQKIIAAAQAKAQHEGVAVEAVTLETHGQLVADVIVGQARKHKADLIVLGTHGRRGLHRLVMGSDAENVVRQAPVPVLLVKGHHP